jgi:hypothetical protein
LLALSINKMEMLVICHYKTEPDSHWGLVNLSRRVLEERFDSLRAIADWYGWSLHHREYEASGGTCLVFTSTIRPRS